MKRSYKRLFVASDCSTRGEYILPFAISLAQYYESQIILGTVIEKPEIIQRLPLTEDEINLANQLSEINQRTATHCHKQITTQLALKGLDYETHVRVADHAIGALHDLVEEAKKAIETDPKNMAAHFSLGLTYEYNNQIDEAIASYEKTIDINPHFVGAYIYLGDLYSETGDGEKAIKAYEKVIELDPNGEFGMYAKEAIERAQEHPDTEKIP